MAPYLFLAFFLFLAIAGPLFGADSRDGRDWWPIGRLLDNARPSGQHPSGR